MGNAARVLQRQLLPFFLRGRGPLLFLQLYQYQLPDEARATYISLIEVANLNLNELSNFKV